MFEREPNIDVVFRNGLKNMEVLPPADVWDNIPPMPVRKSPLRTITGIAAGVAALVSIALFANWYLRSNNPVAPLAEIILAGSGENAVTVDRPAAAVDDLNRGLPAASIEENEHYRDCDHYEISHSHKGHSLGSIIPENFIMNL